MTTEIPNLANLEYLPYIDAEGKLPLSLQKKIGVYAIFDRERILQFIGYSRDIYLSLKQHLVRQPQLCHWLKAQTIDRPNRTILENIKQAWIAENGFIPAGNNSAESEWERPIDAKVRMTAEEKARDGEIIDDVAREKFLKQVARRVEAEILAELKARGVSEEIRFNPKLKTSGLLDLR
ncbi:MAG: GIY-YIG nuclease family protein [Okeania sp. SIO2H7]|nr:GIY-YIG nuclease family protein [Okeania sp. SIO2H7]